MRLAFGNGLRPDVWPKFKARFGLERIAEVYASTEGNANLANTEGKEGAIGFVSPLLAPMYPVKLVRVDETPERDLLRAADGRCVPCKPGEPGAPSRAAHRLPPRVLARAPPRRAPPPSPHEPAARARIGVCVRRDPPRRLCA